MSYLPCDNDILSDEFESKLDPMFRADHVSEYEKRRRRSLDFNEERSGFVVPKRKPRLNAMNLGRGMMPIARK